MDELQMLVATTNRHKAAELAKQLEGFPVRVILAAEGTLPEVWEDQPTFAGNAALKATIYAQAAGLLTLADDSGLEVAALDGKPGVHSARWAGEPSNPAANNARLLHELRDVPPGERGARFVCVLALADPHAGLLWTVEGVCNGEIALAPSGEHGFGYDPLFFHPPSRATFAQLSAAEKAAVSHRGQALAAFRQRFEQWLKQR
jgi:XTP/dITP diphosphohydrolase